MSKLENNTTSLEAIMDKVNGVSNEVNSQAAQIAEIAALLDGKSVGSGNGSVEACAVSLLNDSRFAAATECYYIAPDGSSNTLNTMDCYGEEANVSVRSGSYMYIPEVTQITGNATLIHGDSSSYCLVHITGDAAITMTL